MSNPYLRVIHGKSIVSQKPRQMLIDVYDLFTAYDVHPVLVNAIKKCLVPGGRHQKDEVQDLTEAMRCIERRIEQINISEKLNGKSN